MATKKRKSKKKGHSPRRKRVGANSGSRIEDFAMKILGVGVGAIGGAFVIQAGNTALGTAAAGSTMPLWAVPTGVALAGAGMQFIDEPIINDIGLGMAAIGAVFSMNEFGISVPGISGMAMSSNASPMSNTLRKAVGQGPNKYLNQTVGNAPRRKMNRLMGIGALTMN